MELMFAALIADTVSIVLNNYSDDELRKKVSILFERENITVREQTLDVLVDHIKTLKSLKHD